LGTLETINSKPSQRGKKPLISMEKKQDNLEFRSGRHFSFLGALRENSLRDVPK
jgi:hypothetical protein